MIQGMKLFTGLGKVIRASKGYKNRFGKFISFRDAYRFNIELRRKRLKDITA